MNAAWLFGLLLFTPTVGVFIVVLLRAPADRRVPAMASTGVVAFCAVVAVNSVYRPAPLSWADRNFALVLFASAFLGAVAGAAIALGLNRSNKSAKEEAGRKSG